jgi:hypothetical protein
MAALAVTLPLVPSIFAGCLHTHTLPDTESSKVGKTEKIQPAVSRRRRCINAGVFGEFNAAIAALRRKYGIFLAQDAEGRWSITDQELPQSEII